MSLRLWGRLHPRDLLDLLLPQDLGLPSLRSRPSARRAPRAGLRFRLRLRHDRHRRDRGARFRTRATTTTTTTRRGKRTAVTAKTKATHAISVLGVKCLRIALLNIGYLSFEDVGRPALRTRIGMNCWKKTAQDPTCSTDTERHRAAPRGAGRLADKISSPRGVSRQALPSRPCHRCSRAGRGPADAQQL